MGTTSAGIKNITNRRIGRNGEQMNSGNKIFVKALLSILLSNYVGEIFQLLFICIILFIDNESLCAFSCV